jgi:hypothetical protein
VRGHRRDDEDRGEHSQPQREEEDDAQRGVQLAEPLLERHGEEEAGEDLQPGLRDAQLLEQLAPVAVGALRRGLVALRAVGVPRVAPVPASLRVVIGRHGRAACHARRRRGIP